MGNGSTTGTLKIQRKTPGGLKSVTQTAKGLQEIFIRTGAGLEAVIAEAIKELG